MKYLYLWALILLAQNIMAQDNRSEVNQHYANLNSLWSSGKYDEFVSYVRKVEPWFKRNNRLPYCDYFQLQVNYLAAAHRQRGKYQEAENLLDTLQPLIEQVATKLHPLYFDVLFEKGKIYRANNEDERAYESFSQAWKGIDFWVMARKNLYIDLGCELIKVCTILGKYNEGEYYIKKIEARKSYIAYSNSQLLEYNIALMSHYISLGSFQKAESCILNAFSMLPNKTSYINKKIDLQNAYAYVLSFSSRLNESKMTLLRLLKELDSLNLRNSSGYYKTTMALVTVLQKNGEKKEAENLLTTVLAGLGKEKNGICGLLYFQKSGFRYSEGDFETALGNIDSAISLLQQTNPIWEHKLMVDIWKSVVLLKLKRFEEAKLFYEKSISIYTDYVKNIISFLSEKEKITFIQRNSVLRVYGPNFISLSKKLSRSDDVKKYWTQNLFFKGLTGKMQVEFYEALRLNTDTLLKKKYKNWKNAERLLQKLLYDSVNFKRKKIDSVAWWKQDIEQELLFALPKNIPATKEVSIENIHGGLKQSEAIIDFTTYQKITTSLKDSAYFGAYILCHNYSAPLFVNICPDAQLRVLYNSATSQKYPAPLYPSDIQNPLHSMPGNTLYKLLWQPLRQYLKGIKKVYIVGDGLLHKIAFHALPLPKGGFLSDSIEIHYLSHTSRICDSSFRITEKPKGVEIWAGIHYNTKKIGAQAAVDTLTDIYLEPDWRNLSGTSQEADSIQKFCVAQKIPCRRFSGDAASESVFKQVQSPLYDILFIGTHGQFDAATQQRNPDFALYPNLPFTLLKNPMQQVSLVMAGRNQLKRIGLTDTIMDDGLLSAAEIAQLDLSGKKLVVLSACESGLGEILNTEGVFGMVRALKIAGVEKVIASLWDVDDETGQLMMTELFNRILSGKAIPQAFREAQQHIRKMKHKTPYHWAGFVLIE